MCTKAQLCILLVWGHVEHEHVTISVVKLCQHNTNNKYPRFDGQKWSAQVLLGLENHIALMFHI